MIIKKNLFSLSLKDFFTPYFLALSLLPLLITLAILFAGLFHGMNYLNTQLNRIHIEQNHQSYSDATQSMSQDSVNITIDDAAAQDTSLLDINPIDLLEKLQTSQILSSFLENDIMRWIIEKLLFLIAGYFILILAVIIAVSIIGFFTPLVVKKLKTRHYPPFAIKGHGNALYSLWFTLKSLLVMLLLYVILIPLYFIPFINIIAFNLPAYYFFHKMLVFDVGSTINTKEEYTRIKALVANQLRLRTFIMYLMTLIPLVGILFPLFFVIYLSHIFMNESIELRQVTGQ